MSGLPSGPRAGAAAIGALAIALLLAVGCGSGGDAEPSTAGGSGQLGAGGKPDGAGAGQTAEGGGGAAKSARKRGSAGANGTGKSEAEARQGAAAGGSETVRAADRAAVRSCVARFGKAVCAEMVRQAGAPGVRIDGPDDCLKAMSRARCEALAAAQREAGEQGGSVNLEECIDNPTPRCEAVLRPILEAQRGR